MPNALVTAPAETTQVPPVTATDPAILITPADHAEDPNAEAVQESGNAESGPENGIVTTTATTVTLAPFTLQPSLYSFWSQFHLTLNPISYHDPAPTDPAAPMLTQTPTPLQGHTMAFIPGSTSEFLIFGGFRPTTSFIATNLTRNTLYRLSSQDLTLTEIVARGDIPSARAGHASVTIGNAMVVWGGRDDTTSHLDDGLYFYNIGESARL